MVRPPSEVKILKAKFLNQAQVLKDTLAQLDNQAKGVEQRKLVKDLKTNYAKEVERQKRLLRSFVNQSFNQRFSRISNLKASRGMMDKSDQNLLFVDSNYVIVGRNNDRPMPTSDNKNYSNDNESLQQSYSINEHDQQLEFGNYNDEEILQLEQKLENEKQEELDDIEQEAILLNKLVGELGIIVIDQDTQLNVAQGNQQDVQINIHDAHEELQRTQSMQQQKKRYLLAFIALIVIIASVILILLISRAK